VASGEPVICLVLRQQEGVEEGVAGTANATDVAAPSTAFAKGGSLVTWGRETSLRCQGRGSCRNWKRAYKLYRLQWTRNNEKYYSSLLYRFDEG